MCRQINRQYSLLIAIFVFVIFAFQTVAGQFPIKIPKITKSETPQTEQPKSVDKQNQSGYVLRQSADEFLMFGKNNFFGRK